MIFTALEPGGFGMSLSGLDLRRASDAQLTQLREQVYRHRVVVIRDQPMTAAEYLAVGQRLGAVETYYQPMYHHPEVKEVFVSSNVAEDGQAVGVPRTGRFWHADYQFMDRPFAFTLVHQRVVPKGLRGTLFMDMARAWQSLPDRLREQLRGTTALHSPRRYFKIRPSDVYRPICELLDEIEQETPPARHPTVVTHPVTGEEFLFVSEGATYAFEDANGEELSPRVLRQVLEATGQLDETYSHPNIHKLTYNTNDLVMWDNRILNHCALHTPVPEPTVTWRLTLYDELAFGAAARAGSATAQA